MEHIPANNRMERSTSTTFQRMKHWNQIQIFYKKTHRSNEKFKKTSETSKKLVWIDFYEINCFSVQLEISCIHACI